MRNMPSAAAKIEKPASSEAPDSFKSILVIFEKKTRNLEKRKGRLDHLKSELDQGKALNDDQKAAVLKYDQVVEALEFTRDLQKAITGIMQDHVRACKKAAKREAAERTSRDTQRIREVLQLQDVLTNLGTPEARQCFLDGTSGAVQLQPHDLELMDELYRLVSPESKEGAGQAAEHLTALLDRKNKEVLGTTYKALRELLQNIEECAYFSGTQAVQSTEEQLESTEQEQTSEPVSEEVSEVVQQQQQQEVQPPPVTEAPVEAVQEVVTQFGLETREEEPESNNLHFFQESQIDVELPPAEPVQPAFVAPEFDPTHPIPTQTFTNQSFAPPDRRGGRGPRRGYSNGRGGGNYGGYQQQQQQQGNYNGQDRFGASRARPARGGGGGRGGRGAPQRRGAATYAK